MEIDSINKRLDENLENLEKIYSEIYTKADNLEKLGNNLKKLDKKYSSSIKELEEKKEILNNLIDGGVERINTEFKKISLEISRVSEEIKETNNNIENIKEKLDKHIEEFKQNPFKRWILKKLK